MVTNNNEKMQELTVEEKLQNLYELQRIDTEIDKIKTLRGELPLEVQDLEDEIAGLETRIENLKAELSELDKTTSTRKQEIKKAEDSVAFINEKKAEYETLQVSAASAAKRGYVDSIIAPEDTRKYVIGAFEMLYTKKEERPAKKHGTV